MELNGVIVVDKPRDWTSHDVVAKLRGILRQRKIGDHCKELHIATRWSVRDVIGRLEDHYENSDRARFIVVPAMNENDESNFDYQYGVGFSTEFYREQRETMDPVSWEALYMNHPVERHGLLYNQDDLRYFIEPPTEEPDAVIAICDTKDTGSDYSFLPVGLVYGRDHYIIDCICDNSNPLVVETRLADILVRYKVQNCRFESNSAGGRVADGVQQEVRKRGGITRIRKKFTTGNKETKIINNSPWVQERCLFKDQSTYKPNSDYGRMMKFLCTYTTEGRNKHDDVPDGMAMYAQYAQSIIGAKIEVFKRPI